ALRTAKLQIVLHVWIDSDEGTETMLQNISEKPFAAQDADTSLLHALKKAQLLSQETMLFQNPPAMLQNQLASFGQSHAACVSFKKGQTNLALCFGNLTAHH